MGNFNITILGCGSATPTVRHMPSAQAVAYGGRLMLIDCGEGRSEEHTSELQSPR